MPKRIFDKNNPYDDALKHLIEGGFDEDIAVEFLSEVSQEGGNSLLLPEELEVLAVKRAVQAAQIYGLLKAEVNFPLD